MINTSRTLYTLARRDSEGTSFTTISTLVDERQLRARLQHDGVQHSEISTFLNNVTHETINTPTMTHSSAYERILGWQGDAYRLVVTRIAAPSIDLDDYPHVLLERS